LTQPTFVVGAQRSGTTMLRLMLNQHSRLAIPFESGFIVHFYEKLDAYGDLALTENARVLLRDIIQYPMIADFGRWIRDADAILACAIRNYADLVDAIFRKYAESHGKPRWGDKTPGQETSIDVLCKLFPDCRIVHLVRDGRDVVQSLQRVSWGMRNLPRAAADWRWKVTIGHKLGAMLGPRYLEVKYEDLVLDPEAVLRRICAFLTLGYEPAMLEYPLTARQTMPAESLVWHENSVRAPDPGLVCMWKHQMSTADRTIFEQIAGDALGLFGYEREHRAASFSSRARRFYYANFARW
jgi:hypothetical protein